MAESKTKSGERVRRGKGGRPRVVQDPERIAVDLERPQLDALRQLAGDRGISVAELVRRAVAQLLKRAGRR